MSRAQRADSIIRVERSLSAYTCARRRARSLFAPQPFLPHLRPLRWLMHSVCSVSAKWRWGGGGWEQRDILLGAFHLYLFQFSPHQPPTARRGCFFFASGAKHSRSRTRLTARPRCPPATGTQEMHYHVGLGGVPAHGSLPANSGTVAADSRHIKGTDTHKSDCSFPPPNSTRPIIFNVLRG